MNARLNEGKIIGLILVVLCLLNLISCTKKDQSYIVEYQEMLKKLDTAQIKAIEILYNDWDADVESPQTIACLRDSYRYKITIKNLGGGEHFREALLKYSPVKETNLENDNFRLALLFLGKNNTEIYAMYFSSLSPKVRIGNKMYMVSEDILRSIVPCIPDRSRKSLEEKINSWFSEKSEEQIRKQ